jgi:hypothetical protein
MLRTFRQKRSGFITLMAVVAAIFLFIIGVGLLTLGFNRRLYSIRSNHQLAARCAVDYGLTKAVHELNLRLPGPIPPYPSASGVLISGSNISGVDAKYSYTITKNSGVYYVTAHGTSGSITKTVTCDLRLKSIYEFAILTKNTLDIGSVSTVNCTGCGTFPLKIGTTNNPNIDAEIILKPNSTVEGDILLGQGGIPSLVIGSGATYGNIYAVATDFDLPTPTVPSYLQEGTATNFGTINIHHNGENTTLTPARSGIYENITLNNSGVLTIVGNVEIWVKGNLTLGNSAYIAIDPNAKLTIYISGILNGAYGSGFNNQTVDDPSKLTIYGLSSGSITIKNNGDFCGTIYAPNADVVIDNNAKIYGSVIANNYTQQNSVIFTYDARLRTVTENDKFVRFVPNHWREL